MSKVESAREAYDRFAPMYDECNAQNNYEMWLGDVLLPELEKFGLQKGWALDVGCGTGRAFGPLLARGWHVYGCDLSSKMLAEARQKFGPQVPLLNLDARNLPPIQPRAGMQQERAFQLVLLLNDVLNYLTEDGDLAQAFEGVKRNLSCDQGLAVFDANTLSLFQRDSALEGADQGGEWEWQALARPASPGEMFEARLSGSGIEAHVHRQRHWTTDQIVDALGASGLRCLAVFGQREERSRILLSEQPDEERDEKTIYIVGRSSG